MENHYVTQPAMPVGFDPARYLRQPGRTQVATLVAASFFGCLLALLVVYGLIILATKVMAAKLTKDALNDISTDNTDDLPPAPAPRPQPQSQPQPQRAVIRPATSAEVRLLADVLSSDDEEAEAGAERIDEGPGETPADVPEAGPASPVPKRMPIPTAAKRNSRQ